MFICLFVFDINKSSAPNFVRYKITITFFNSIQIKQCFMFCLPKNKNNQYLT